MTSTHPLTATTWASWARSNYLQDDVVRVVFDKTMPRIVKQYVKSFVAEIEEITGLDIKLRKGLHKVTDKTDVVIRPMEHDDYRGLAFVDPLTGIAHATWDPALTPESPVFTKKGRYKGMKPSWENDRAQHTVGHEILHVFGLSHPHDNGYHPDFTNRETLLSYNFDGVYRGITSLDASALQEIWG